MFRDIACLIIDNSFDESGKLLVNRQEVPIVSKLNHFHEIWGSLRFKNKPGFRCLEATGHYRKDVSRISVCYRLIVRNVSSDNKSQVFILCAK